jgi:uncharacterized membrane protein HdeD (DUF308 family)
LEEPAVAWASSFEHLCESAATVQNELEGGNGMRSEVRSPVREMTGLWWVFLVTGIAWLILALIVLRFDTTSLAAVGALLGAVFLVMGVNELFAAFVRRSWAWAHALLGILFLVGGVSAFFQPFSAFWALASILGFLLLFKGSFDIIGAAMTRDVNDLWWLGLAVGVLEILLAFWVSQQFFAPRAILILIWVGFTCIFRGISEIGMAFQLRRLDRTAERVEAGMAPRAA